MSEWTQKLKDRLQKSYQGMRSAQQGNIRRNAQMYQPLKDGIKVGDKVWYFNPRVVPGTVHKLRNFWLGPYRVHRLIGAALAEIKHLYQDQGTRTVSLDVLKLHHGEDVQLEYPDLLIY